MGDIGEPSDAQILRAAIRARLADVRTSCPGVVVSYDAAKQTATIDLAVTLPKASGGFERLPPIPEVRVKWQRGGGYFCTMPLVEGDAGLLVFCEADFSEWLRTGQISDPATERRHGLYSYFLPGGCVTGRELVDASADHLVIGKDGGHVVKIKAGGIEVGANATQYAALANLVKSEIESLRNWAAGHTHPVTTTGTAAAQSGLAAASATPPSPVGDVAASITKVE